MKDKLESAEREIARLKNINRIQQKQIGRLLDARDAEQIIRHRLEKKLAASGLSPET